jgi:hypothetical protein
MKVLSLLILGSLMFNLSGLCQPVFNPAFPEVGYSINEYRYVFRKLNPVVRGWQFRTS